MKPVTLGPFALDAPIARGGMGEVWRAVHTGQGLPVAVKVLTADHARHPDYAAQLRDEVRAVAALDHPGIVMVLDHGTVGAAAEAATDNRLVAGSPWFAMELASGGTLSGRAAPSWPTLKATLLAILDALAHAHARGVVHRDLKPSNVLIATPTDVRPGLKLTDFGVAHEYHGDLSVEGIVEERVLGTPMYMAPEQIRGEWRDYGAWTDLYALGGLIYKLLTGDAMFPGRSQRATVIAHLAERPRPLMSPHPVPRGFIQWVERLVQKEPTARFRRAADAASALVELGDLGEPSSSKRPWRAADTVSLPALGEHWRLALEVADARPSVLMDTVIGAAKRAHGDDDTTGRQVVIGSSRLPPIPVRWARPLNHPPPAPLVGAGLGLFGLRDAPLVGRERERDVLWGALREVASSGRAKVVLLHGPAGTGKSRLARWLCRRAHEVGAANVARTAFSPQLAPGEALQALGASYLRTGNLRRFDVAERVEAFVYTHGGGEDEARVLTELLCPATPADLEAGAVPVKLTRPSEYYTSTRDAMHRLSQERPFIAWFDDVQWGLHGLGLALQILKSQDEKPFPVLIVMTMRDEEVAGRPDEGRRVARLMEQGGATALRIGPLAHAAHAQLVRGLLRLDGALVSQVEERTNGNPMFAVELVGDWVRRGVLEVAGTGFVLAAGADPSLPDDLHALWSRRLDDALAGFPDSARIYLEIAATLGREVVWPEWKRACDDPEGHFGDRFPGDDALRARLVEQLLLARLAVGDRRAWTFVHGMVKESLERRAAEAGRAAAHHAACAAMLAGREEPEVAERLGRHLLAAGRHDEAVGPLLRGVAMRLLAFGPQAAMSLLDSTDAAIVRAALPERDPRRGFALLARAQVRQALGDAKGAGRAAEAALLEARRHGWRRVRAEALAVRAEALLAEGDLDGAGEHFRALSADGGPGAPRALVGLARLAQRRGDLTGSHALLTEARSLLQGGDAPLLLAECELQLARGASARGDATRARDLFRLALGRFEAGGGGWGAARCLEGIGELSAEAGELEASEAALSSALSLHDALGSARSLRCALAVARVRIQRGRLDAALELVEGTRARIASLPYPERVAGVLAIRLIEAAAAGDPSAWDRAAAELPLDRPPASAAVGGLVALAGLVVHMAGDSARAESAFSAAERALRAVGDVAGAASVRSGLSLDGGRPTG